MIHRFLLCAFLFTLVASAQPAELNAASNFDRTAGSWDWSYDTEEGGASSYLGVDIADVSPERLGELKLKEEHGAEVTMVDQDAPAGKAGLHEHDVIVSLNGTAVESAAQLRRMIKEIPPGRVVSLGISRDGQPLTIKVQLADRHKSTGWDQSGKFEMPKMPKMPDLPEFDLPVSVVVVHSGMRSGLMVENITPQLGDFFGVKGGKGVLVRSVEKGSRGEKAGFRAGDVVVKVNNQPVHDSSDFTHALRSSPGSVASVTVVREKKEQTLTLTLPDKKDSGSLQEDSFDCPELSLETEQAINRAEEVLARMSPAIMQKAQQEALRSRDMDLRHLDKKLQDFQRRMQERQQEMQERHHRLRHELSGDWAEI
jgi:serine protease Do